MDGAAEIPGRELEHARPSVTTSIGVRISSAGT